MTAITKIFLATITLVSVGVAAAAAAADAIYFERPNDPAESAAKRKAWSEIGTGLLAATQRSGRCEVQLGQTSEFADAVEDWLRSRSHAEAIELPELER